MCNTANMSKSALSIFFNSSVEKTSRNFARMEVGFDIDKNQMIPDHFLLSLSFSNDRQLGFVAIENHFQRKSTIIIIQQMLSMTKPRLIWRGCDRYHDCVWNHRSRVGWDLDFRLELTVPHYCSTNPMNQDTCPYISTRVFI